MVKMFGSITDLSSVMVAKENKLSTIEFMRTGKWDHPVYGKIEITKSRLEKFKENFDTGVRNKIPIDIEHKTDAGAVGWVHSFSVEEFTNDAGEKQYHLMGEIEWTDEGVALVKSKKYRFFSPEFTDVYKNAKSGDTFNDVILGGAITNRPFFQELDEVVVLSEDNAQVKNKKQRKPSMTKEEMMAKLRKDAKFCLPDDASDEDKKTMQAAKAELFSEVTEKATTAETAKTEAETKLAEAETKLSEAKEAATKTFAEQNAEAAQIFAELGIKDVAGAKQLSEKLKAQETEAVKAELTKLVLPKSLDKTLEFAMKLDAEARKSFMETLKEQNVVSMFSELGGEAAGDEANAGKAPEGIDQASFDLDFKAKELIKNKPEQFKEMTGAQAYREALFIVSKEASKKGSEE